MEKISIYISVKSRYTKDMTTEQAPKVPLAQFKRTKIIATLGPSVDSYEQVVEMLRAGVNGFRLNFSHASYEQSDQNIKWVRKASREHSKPVAIIQDLQGPKIRLGDFHGFIPLQKGQDIKFEYKVEYLEGGPIPTQYDLAKKVHKGERLLLSDGRIRTTITGVVAGIVHARVENNGILTQRKGINLPDTDFGGDVITEKDKKDIEYGAGRDIDFVAQSFVQTAADIEKLRHLLETHHSKARIIAKVETKKAVDNIEEIVAASDAVMVARGDLAQETEPESVPIVQRSIIGLCLKYDKVSIVATQMLGSMTDEPEPTRAEVSDVATAVLVGSDAVMLSDETASGKYPIEAIQMMKRIILYTETNAPLRPEFFDSSDDTIVGSISNAVISLADQVGATAIVAETKSGNTARKIASNRPSIPIIMVTSDEKVAQQLAIVYGGKSFVRPDDKKAATKMTDWLKSKRVLKKGDIIIITSGKYPGEIGGTDTIKVRKLA